MMQSVLILTSILLTHFAQAGLKIDTHTDSFQGGVILEKPAGIETEVLSYGDNPKLVISIDTGVVSISAYALKRSGYSIGEFQKLMNDSIGNDTLMVTVKSLATHINANGAQEMSRLSIKVKKTVK